VEVNSIGAGTGEQGELLLPQRSYWGSK